MFVNVRFLCRCLSVVALCFGVEAVALDIPENTPVRGAAPSGAPMVLTVLQKFESAPAETKVAFLKRVGMAMQDYSAHNKVETCASIWEDARDTHWVLQLATAKSHIGCVIITENPTNDASLVRDEATIHSHPIVHQAKTSAADVALQGGAEGRTLELYNATFSPDDKAAGPGYLVANRHLQYQKEGGRVYQDLGALDET